MADTLGDSDGDGTVSAVDAVDVDVAEGIEVMVVDDADTSEVFAETAADDDDLGTKIRLRNERLETGFLGLIDRAPNSLTPCWTSVMAIGVNSNETVLGGALLCWQKRSGLFSQCFSVYKGVISGEILAT